MSGHGEHVMAQPGARGGSPHAGMQHGTVAPGSPHAGMQHGAPARRPGSSQPTTESPAGDAGHGGMQPAPAGMTGGSPPAPLAKAAVAGPGQPAATLEPDPLDAPAATSQMDAKRSAEMAASMGSGGHGMSHGTGSYRQLDAGRESMEKAPPGMPGHEGMGHGSLPPSTPTPATIKPHPAVTPAPTSRGHVHPSGGGPR
jgi:hypothetical protein